MVEERKKSHSTNLLYLGAKMMGPLLLLGGMGDVKHHRCLRERTHRVNDDRMNRSESWGGVGQERRQRSYSARGSSCDMKMR